MLGGEHDLASAPIVRRSVDGPLQEGSHLVIDISSAEFIDSSIINVLVHAKNDTESRGCGFSLVLGASSAVGRTLELAGVLPLLNPVPTLERALATG